MSRKKILVVGDCISGSGLTEVIFNIFRKIKDEYEVTLIGYGEDKSNEIEERCKKLKWKFYRTPLVNKHPIDHWIFWKKFFNNHKFEIVYFNYSSSWNFLPVIFAKKAGTQIVVCHSHNSNYSHRFNNRILMLGLDTLNSIGRKIFDKYADKKVATSKEAAAWMFGKKNLNNVYISINGVDTRKFSFQKNCREYIREKYHLVGKEVIGFVGVLQDRKNPLFALKVFYKIKKRRKNSVMVMIGKGPLLSKIDDEIKRLNLNNSVIQIPYSSEVNKWYSAMDVLLFPSLHEGLPLVLIEAQISGLNIVSSKNISTLAYVNPNVKRVSLKDVNSWANTASNLLNTEFDRSRPLKKIEKFSNDTQAKNIKKILSDKYEKDFTNRHDR